MSRISGAAKVGVLPGWAAWPEPLRIMRCVVRHGVPGAKVAELVDAQDLGSCGATRESSSLSFRTSPRGYRHQAVTVESERINGAR